MSTVTSSTRRYAQPAIWAAFIAAAILVRVHDHRVFPLWTGHDGGAHTQRAIEAARGEIPKYYCPPFYYWWVAAHRPIAPTTLARRDGGPEFALMAPAVALANLHLFIWYVAGIVCLCRTLRLSWSQSLACGALAATLPMVHRSLNMIRPENLMLALLPWTAVAGLYWNATSKPILRNWRFWMFAIGAAVLAAQKVGGLPLPIVLLAMLARARGHWRERLPTLAAALLVIAGLTGMLVVAHHLATGEWMFRHFAYGNAAYAAYNNRAPLEFFTTVTPLDAWANPFRNSQRLSMANILALDLFGDYWRYGIDHTMLNLPTPVRTLRAHLALVSSWILAIAWLGGLVALWWRPDGERQSARAAALLSIGTVVLAVGYLSASALILFNPAKGDLFKWEYIVWCAPALVLPPAAVLQSPSRLIRVAALAAMLGFAAVGLYQSVLPAFPPSVSGLILKQGPLA